MATYEQIKARILAGEELNEEEIDNMGWILVIEFIETLKRIERKIPAPLKRSP